MLRAGEGCIFQRLLPFTAFSESKARRVCAKMNTPLFLLLVLAASCVCFHDCHCATYTCHVAGCIGQGGVIGCIRNCCLASSNHEWLLSSEVDILPHLLLPLVGPEELDEDDMDGMPDELQYQPPDKTREDDPTIRKHLLESLLQLCATRPGRLTLRDKKVRGCDCGARPNFA